MCLFCTYANDTVQKFMLEIIHTYKNKKKKKKNKKEEEEEEKKKKKMMMMMMMMMMMKRSLAKNKTKIAMIYLFSFYSPKPF